MPLLIIIIKSIRIKKFFVLTFTDFIINWYWYKTQKRRWEGGYECVQVGGWVVLF